MGNPMPLILGAQVLDEGPPDDEGSPPRLTGPRLR